MIVQKEEIKHIAIFYFSLGVEDTLWTGTPSDFTDPDAPIALSEVRKLVNNGQFAEATEFATNLSGNPSDVSFFFACIFVIL